MMGCYQLTQQLGDGCTSLGEGVRVGHPLCWLHSNWYFHYSPPSLPLRQSCCFGAYDIQSQDPVILIGCLCPEEVTKTYYKKISLNFVMLGTQRALLWIPFLI